MADLGCGMSGEPLNPQNPQPQQMGGGGTYRLPARKDAYNPSPMESMVVYRLPGKAGDNGRTAGVLTPAEDGVGRVWTNVATGETRLFPSELEAHAWAARKGFAKTSEAEYSPDALDNFHARFEKITQAGGFDAYVKDYNGWEEAAPWRRALSMILMRFQGNIPRTADLQHAITAADNLSSADRWGRIAEAAVKGGLSPTELYALIPDSPILSRPVNFLRASKQWAHANLLSNRVSLREDGLRLDDPVAQQAREDQWGAEASRAKEYMEGSKSVVRVLQKRLTDYLNYHKLTTFDAFDRYRAAMFTIERSNRFRRELYENINKYVKPEHRQTVGEDFQGWSNWRVPEALRRGDMSMFDPAHAEEVTQRWTELNSIDNPVGFTHENLKGVEAAQAYLDSVPKDKLEAMAGANKLYNHALDETLRQAAESGVGGRTRKQVEMQRKREPHYIPSAENLEGAYRSNPIIARGRTSDITHVPDRIFTALEAIHRDVQRNLWNQKIVADLARSTPSATDIFQIAKQKLVSKEEEADPFWGRAPQLGEGAMGVWYPPKARGDDPIYKTITFNTAASDLRTRQAAKTALAFCQQVSRDSAFVNCPGIKQLGGMVRFMNMARVIGNPAFALKNLAWNLGVTAGSMQGAFGLTTKEAAAVLGGGKDGWGAGYHKTAWEMGKLLLADSFPKAERLKAGVPPEIAAYKEFLQEMGAGYGAIDTRYESPVSKVADIDRNIRADTPLLSRLRGLRKTTADEGVVTALKRSGEIGTDAVAGLWKGWKTINHSPDVAFSYAAAARVLQEKAAAEGRVVKTADDLREWARQEPGMMAEVMEGSRRILPNFSDHGNFQALNLVLPYFNASLQTAPLIARMAKTPTGRGAIMAAIMMGAYGAHAAYEDYGDKARHMAGEDEAAYIGGGFQLPVDYALRPFLVLGQQMVHVQKGHATAAEAGLAAARAMFDAASPVEWPRDASSPGQVAVAFAKQATGLALPIGNVGVLWGADETGEHIYNENPVGPDGSKLLAPANWERNRPQDTYLATQTARLLAKATGGLVDLYPGAVGQLLQNYAPALTGADRALEATNATREGRASPTGLDSAEQFFAAPFVAGPLPRGGARDFHAMMDEHLRESTTRLSLKFNPKTAYYTQLQQTLDHIERTAKLKTPYGSFTRAQLKARVLLAERGGTLTARQTTRAEYAQLDAALSRVADKLADMGVAYAQQHPE